ncbi:hypothetical protein N2382_09235 [SAR92 clade bacterium H921]|nr:hypothetical protein [SAR92 clade bacterium H921]
MKTAADRIAQVKSAIDAGFTSKSGKKDAMFTLSNAFDTIKQEAKQAVYAQVAATGVEVVGSFENGLKQLHHFKPVHADFYLAFAGTEQSVATLHEILDIRDQIKASEIGIKPKTEEQLAAELEAVVATAVKDNGFRTNNFVTNNWVGCQNELGTQWVRIDWYLQGYRTAFHECMGVISEDLKVWKFKGQPHMKGWSCDQISEFYSN